jgi:hypothetical protein
VEQKWVYDRIVSPGDANGSTCIFCKQRIVDESQPAHWTLRAEEDDQDADYPVADGYAHHACTQEKLAAERKSRFTLPEVPGT